MKKCFFLFVGIFVLGFGTVHAANTSGYAWSESVGWFDFSNATVGDSSLSGHAYNDNTGWLVLDGVSNTAGVLGGYAWSESLGYFDFSDAYVDAGQLKGYAYNDNTGWLSFETGTNVTTTWTSGSTINPPARKVSSGSRKKTPVTAPTPTAAVPAGSGSIGNNPRDLELGMEGEDVRLLQQFLNGVGFVVNAVAGGPGSAGYETTFFGTLTQQALGKFQAHHGIIPSAGYFGPKTRAFINAITTNNQ